LNKDVAVFTDSSWQKDVLESAEPVLVDFWAEWCAPCRMIGPSIDAVATRFSGRARVGKLNVDENPQVAQAYEIRSIPTLLVFKAGKVVDQRVGALPGSQIAEMIERQIEPAGVATGRA
jgi:thioredoxin 1